MKHRRQREIEAGARRLRAWRRQHADQLEQALAGPHGKLVAHIMKFLENLGSAPALIALLQAEDWREIDADSRFTLLHEIDAAIIKMRERSGLAPIDDALPGAKLTAFLIVRELLNPFPLERESTPAEPAT